MNAPTYASDYAARRNLIFALKNQGKLAEAMGEIHALQQEGADTADLAVDEADCLARMKQPDRALELLERTRLRFPINAFGRALLAGLLQRAGRKEEAASLFEELAGEPRLTLAVVRRVADHFLQSGEPDRALSLAQRTAPETPAGQRFLASVQAAAGHREAALAVLRRARAQSPDDAHLLEDYVVLRLQDEDPALAAEELQALLSTRSHQDSSRLRERLVQTLRRLDQGEKALELLRECLRRNPDSHYLMANLGYIYKDLGHPQEALAPLESALSRDPHNSYYLSAYFKACSDAGQSERAAAYVAARAKADPGDRRLWGLYKKICRPSRPE